MKQIRITTLVIFSIFMTFNSCDYILSKKQQREVKKTTKKVQKEAKKVQNDVEEELNQ